LRLTAVGEQSRGGGGELRRRPRRRLLVAAGLPTTTRLYDLRRGFASLLLAAGEHPKVVADQLGHSTTRLTLDTYTHVLPELTRQTADHLDAILSRERLL
jgi:integrase